MWRQRRKRELGRSEVTSWALTPQHRCPGEKHMWTRTHAEGTPHEDTEGRPTCPDKERLRGTSLPRPHQLPPSGFRVQAPACGSGRGSLGSPTQTPSSRPLRHKGHVRTAPTAWCWRCRGCAVSASGVEGSTCSFKAVLPAPSCDTRTCTCFLIVRGAIAQRYLYLC